MSNAHPEFNLRVTDDRMAVLLDCTIPAGGLDPLLTRVEAELMSLDIPKPPKRAELEQILRHAAEDGSSLTDAILMEGRQPVPPQDGEIKWAEDFFSSGFAVDEKTGAIDYRQHVDHLTVEEGRLLAHLTLAKEGEDGRDVYRKPIPVGRPKQPRIRAGSNVREEKKEDGSHFYATSSGRIRWASNVLAVDEVYHIHESVGLETGDIKHPGTVVIDGDVLAGSRVEAGGDIEVRGSVEAADIQAGGNLTVHRGITGVGNEGIKVRGGVRAKFILEADIQAGEDVVVESEIIQSTLKTRGALTISAGRLVGGGLTALGGVVVGQLGSDGLVPTLVVVGEDYALEEELYEIRTQIPRLAKDLERIHKTVDPLMTREKTLTQRQREAASELLARAADMETAIETLNVEKETIKEDSRARAKLQVFIGRRVYPETTIRIRDWTLLVGEEAKGPVRAALMGKQVVLLSA